MSKNALAIYHFGVEDPLTRLLKEREGHLIELDLRYRGEALEEQVVEGPPRQDPFRQLKYLRFYLDLHNECEPPGLHLLQRGLPTQGREAGRQAER
jgi:hypothetical protein